MVENKATYRILKDPKDAFGHLDPQHNSDPADHQIPIPN